MSITSPPQVSSKKEDTTKNIKTESVTIQLPGQVIQCSAVCPAPAWTVRAGPWLTSVN